MLVLTRKIGEKIVISGKDLGLEADIVLTVVKVDPGKVKLGFEAPKRIGINRLEVEEAIRREKVTAS